MPIMEMSKVEQLKVASVPVLRLDQGIWPNQLTISLTIAGGPLMRISVVIILIWVI